MAFVFCLALPSIQQNVETIFNIVNKSISKYNSDIEQDINLYYKNYEEVKNDMGDGNYIIVEYYNTPTACFKYRVDKNNPGLFFIGPICYDPDYCSLKTEHEIFDFLVEAGRNFKCSYLVVEVMSEMTNDINKLIHIFGFKICSGQTIQNADGYIINTVKLRKKI